MAKCKQVNIAKIVGELVRAEGKKVEVSVGNIREVVALLSDMIYKDEHAGTKHRGVIMALYGNGKRRSRRAG